MGPDMLLYSRHEVKHLMYTNIEKGVHGIFYVARKPHDTFRTRRPTAGELKYILWDL